MFIIFKKRIWLLFRRNFFSYDLIIQSYLNIIIMIILQDQIKKELLLFFKKQKFNDLQENVEFVFNEIQTQFYTAYMDDFQNIKKILENQTLYINCIFLIFQTSLIIIVTILWGIYMIRKIKIFNEEVNLFYIGFYKDKLNLDIN